VLSLLIVSSSLVRRWHLTDWKLIVAVAALVISFGSLWSSHVFQRRVALARLLDRFEAGHFHVRLWRVEQVTRLEGEESSDITRRTIREVESCFVGNQDRVDTFNNALAKNWKTERFDMQELYFFALQVRTWMPSTKWFARRSARKLNRAFGYQLLSTFLDQRMTACRLLPDPDHVGISAEAAPSYYPTHYGLFDKAYNDAVDWLAEDLFKDRYHLPGRIYQVLTSKRANIDALLKELSPQAASKTEQPPTLDDITSAAILPVEVDAPDLTDDKIVPPS
jgi:hypothetical protein